MTVDGTVLGNLVDWVVSKIKSKGIIHCTVDTMDFRDNCISG